MTKRAAIYARVSTDEQAEHGYSRESQVEACRQYASKNGMKVKAEWREDYSGAKLDRPELNKLREAVERHEVDAIVVYSPDRFTRNLAHSLILREEFQRAGVELHYCNRGKMEDTPESRMTENIEAVFGDYWREKITEGSKRGRRAKAAAGKWVGNARPPYGYRREGKRKDAKLFVDDFESLIVKRIFEMYVNEKKTTRSIVSALTAEGVKPPNRGLQGRGWYHVTINNILDRKAYIGQFEYVGQEIPLPHLAIIDRALFEEAQARREKNKQLCKRNGKRHYLLSGYVFCSCGMRMVGTTINGIRKLYRCGARYNYVHLTKCKEKDINGLYAEPLVWSWLSGLLLDREKMRAGLDDYAGRQLTEAEPKRKRVTVLETGIAKLESKIKRLTKLAGDSEEKEIAAEYDAQAKQAGRDKTALVVERDRIVADLQQGELTPEKRASIESWADEIRDGIAADDVSHDAKRSLLDWLNIKAKVEYREGERGLSVSCELRYGDTWLSIEKDCQRNEYTPQCL